MTKSRIAGALRILLADCSVEFKQSAADSLTRKGFTVEIAGSAEEAFEKVRVFRPHLTFYDLDLPGYEGFEALTLIAKMRAGKEGMLVASSSHANHGYREKALAAGAWDYHAKPIDTELLLETAAAVKCHVNRPKGLPQTAQDADIRIVNGKCARPGCDRSTVSFLPRKKRENLARDQFETPIYAGEDEERDYNLLSVTVCPACYFAVDASEAPDETVKFNTALAAECAPAMLKIASEADDTLFSEDRTPEAALVSYRLAVMSQRCFTDDHSAADLDYLASLLLKAASVAHTAGDERAKDKLFADAEVEVAKASGLEPCAAVYRSAYRLVALYVFFMRDIDAARSVKLFDGYAVPLPGRSRPRDLRALETYLAATERILAEKDLYRRANYLAGL